MIGANFILNQVLGQSMGPLIGGIETLQIILHICLTDVRVPANAQIVFNEIFKIVSYDPIDIQDQVEDFFNLDGELQVEMEGNFEQLGYESSYIISNMGSLVIINAFQVCYVAFMALFLAFEKTRKWASKKLGNVFFNKNLAFF